MEEISTAKKWQITTHKNQFLYTKITRTCKTNPSSKGNGNTILPRMEHTHVCTYMYVHVGKCIHVYIYIGAEPF